MAYRSNRGFWFEGKKYYWNTLRKIPRHVKRRLSREARANGFTGNAARKAIIVAWTDYEQYETY